MSTDKKDSHDVNQHKITHCDQHTMWLKNVKTWEMTHTSKFIKNRWQSKVDKIDDFMIFCWFCGNIKIIKKIHKEIVVIIGYCQQSSIRSNSMKMMIDFDDMVNVFDKLLVYWEIRRVSMETMKFVQISDFMTKVIFEEIIWDSEKMSLKIIDKSFVVMKTMGKSIENNQNMISQSYLTKGKSKWL